MHFSTFIWRNLARRKARSILTIIGLSVAIAAVIALVGVSEGFEQTFLATYNAKGVDLVVQKSGGTQRLNSSLPQSMAKEIEAISGVRLVMYGLLDILAMPEHDLYAVVVNGWNYDDPQLTEQTLVAGRFFGAGDRKTVMLGKMLAENLDKKVGDTINLYDKSFEVVGIYEGYSRFENGGIVVPLPELQRLTQRPNQVTGFLIQVEPDLPVREREELQNKIAALQNDLVVMPKAEFIGSVNQIQISRALAWVISAIAVVIGAIGMLNTMIMSVFERTREIGTLRAMGWRKSRVVRMVLGESIVLSFAGAIAGTLLAIGLTQLLSSLPNTSGMVEGHISTKVVLQGLIVAFLVGVLGAIYPAWWGANLAPMQAMRTKF